VLAWPGDLTDGSPIERAVRPPARLAAEAADCGEPLEGVLGQAAEHNVGLRGGQEVSAGDGHKAFAEPGGHGVGLAGVAQPQVAGEVGVDLSSVEAHFGGELPATLGTEGEFAGQCWIETDDRLGGYRAPSVKNSGAPHSLALMWLPEWASTLPHGRVRAARLRALAADPVEANRRGPGRHECRYPYPLRGLGVQNPGLGLPEPEPGLILDDALVDDRQPAQHVLESHHLAHSISARPRRQMAPGRVGYLVSIIGTEGGRRIVNGPAYRATLSSRMSVMRHVSRPGSGGSLLLVIGR